MFPASLVVPLQCFDALRADADVYTIGRDRVAWLHAQFIQDGKQVVEWPCDTVVADESQSFASASSQRFKALADLRVKTRFPSFIELSGTPMPNGYEKLWSQLWLLDRGKRLGNSFSAFRDRWFTPPVGIFTKWNIKPHAPGEIHERLKDIVLALRESIILNFRLWSTTLCAASFLPPQSQRTRSSNASLSQRSGARNLPRLTLACWTAKLLQLANGACYHARGAWVPFHDAKLEVLGETLEGIAGKALIAYNFNHDKARIQTVLAKLGESEGKTWRLLDSDGDFQDWADGKIDWGLLHPASAGHGLNDVYKGGADDLVFFGLTNNLEWYEQIRARLTGGHRRVDRNIRVHHIVADGTRDDDYVRLIQRKALAQDNLMAALATRIA